MLNKNNVTLKNWLSKNNGEVVSNRLYLFSDDEQFGH